MDDFELDDADIQSEYEAELIDKAIADLSTDNIRLYLATNGDAIETRVIQTLAEAEQLLTSGYPGSALTSAVTSIEIILRFFVFRPILHGAFLPEQWTQILLQKVVSGRTYTDRELLPKITKHWSIDLEKIRLADGRVLWSTLLKEVWPIRNDVVHRGANASAKSAQTAIDCTKILLNEVVTPLANRIGIDKSKTGVWHIVRKDSANGYSEEYYTASDPFND